MCNPYNRSTVLQQISFDSYRQDRSLRLVSAFLYNPYLCRLLIKLTYETRTLDVPYSDHFYMRETLFVLAPSENSVKVILRSENCCVFVKSTMFKNKILARSFDDINAYFKNWLLDIEARGFMDPARHSEQRQKRIQEELKSVRESGGGGANVRQMVQQRMDENVVLREKVGGEEKDEKPKGVEDLENEPAPVAEKIIP